METPRVLWRDERAKFLAALDSVERHRERRRAEMLVLYDSGCRVSELVALNVSSYNRARSALMIPNVKQAGHPLREVPLHPRTIRALNAWLRLSHYDSAMPLFCSQKGERLSVRQVQRDYLLVCQLAGLTPLGVHTLRHTSATRLLDDKVLPIHQLSRRLGHASTTTTYKYYVHGSVEEESRAIRHAKL